MPPRRASDLCMSSRKVPRSHSFLQLLERSHVGRQCLAISQLSGPVTAFRIEKVQQASGATLISILTDVTRVLGLLQVSRSVKLYHFFVTSESFIGIANIRQHGIAGRRLQLLGLRQSIASACDLALIAVEDGQIEIHEERSAIYARGVGIVDGTVNIAFAIGFRQQNLALSGGYSQFGSPKIRAFLQCPCLQVFQLR